MIAGKTRSGFDYEFNEKVFKDWRIIRGITEITKPNANADKAMDSIFLTADLVFGDKIDEYIQFIADANDGIADIEVITADLMDLLADHDETKN